MKKNRELLLLVMLEDVIKVLNLIGYGKVSEKIEQNLKRIYVNGRPDTSGIRQGEK